MRLLRPETIIVIYIYTVTIMESKSDPFFISDVITVYTAVQKGHTLRKYLIYVDIRIYIYVYHHLCLYCNPLCRTYKDSYTAKSIEYNDDSKSVKFRTLLLNK